MLTYSQMVRKNVTCQETKTRSRGGGVGEGGAERELIKMLTISEFSWKVYQSPLHYFYNFSISLKLYQNYIKGKYNQQGEDEEFFTGNKNNGIGLYTVMKALQGTVLQFSS